MENVFSKYLNQQISIKQNLAIARVNSLEQGTNLVANLLYKLSNNSSLIFLSGGKTPHKLYKKLAKEKRLKALSVALVDERFGTKFHINSNESVIIDSGLIKYFEQKNISFFPILNKSKNLKITADNYEKLIEKILKQKCSLKIAIFGIGADGHTAVIIPSGNNFNNPIFTTGKNRFVYYFTNNKGIHRKRISITFKSIKQMDYNLIMAFGKDKQTAIAKMFKKGTKSKIPARIFLSPKIARKTLLVTDMI